MKLSELHMHCGNCQIIDYCNDYEDTPPCAQPRFENVEIDRFKLLAESSKYGESNDILDDIHNKLCKEQSLDILKEKVVKLRDWDLEMLKDQRNIRGKSYLEQRLVAAYNEVLMAINEVRETINTINK